MLAMAGHLSPTAHAASVIVAGARTAGIDALPLLRAVQGMGLRLGPGEFRALVNDDSIHIDMVYTLPPCAAVPKLWVNHVWLLSSFFTQNPLLEPCIAAPVLCKFGYWTKALTPVSIR